LLNVIALGIPRSLYAVIKSLCAIEAALLVSCVEPPIVTLPVLVYDVPGDSPLSLPAVPDIVVAPVFVIVVPASTPYVVVVPWRTDGSAAADFGVCCGANKNQTRDLILIRDIVAQRQEAFALSMSYFEDCSINARSRADSSSFAPRELT
jgi:hypothetical protein